MNYFDAIIYDKSLHVNRGERMIFNERLKLLRKEHKLTQTQVAEQLSVTLRNYQRFEADGNTPNYVNLIKIADIFDVSLDYLTGRTDKREVNR